VAKALTTSEIVRTCHATRLPLVYYPYERNFASRTAGSSDKSNIGTITTLCGQNIVFDGRKATIALTIQIGDGVGQRSYALTVDHLFDLQQQTSSSATEAMIENDAEVAAQHALQSTNADEVRSGTPTTPPWLLNVKYDDSAGSHPWSSNLAYHASTARLSRSEMEISKSGLKLDKLSLAGDVSADQGFALSSTSYLFARSGYTKPYLDWALIDLEQLQWPVLSNLVIYPENEPHIVSKVASQPALEQVLDVLVVTAGKGIVEGILHPSHAFLGNPRPTDWHFFRLGRAQVVTFRGHYSMLDLNIISDLTKPL